MGTLDREIATYESSLPALLDHAGEYVLIKDTLVVGFYPTRRAALDAAYARFLDEAFLVRQVLPGATPRTTTRGVRPG